MVDLLFAFVERLWRRKSECDSLEARNSVVRIISSDSNNALVSYAARNSNSVAAMVSNTNTESDKLAILEKARRDAVYRLDDRVVTNPKGRATRAVTCSGLLYVTVGDTTAQKQVDFKSSGRRMERRPFQSIRSCFSALRIQGRSAPVLSTLRNLQTGIEWRRGRMRRTRKAEVPAKRRRIHNRSGKYRASEGSV